MGPREHEFQEISKIIFTHAKFQRKIRSNVATQKRENGTLYFFALKIRIIVLFLGRFEFCFSAQVDTFVFYLQT